MVYQFLIMIERYLKCITHDDELKIHLILIR